MKLGQILKATLSTSHDFLSLFHSQSVLHIVPDEAARRKRLNKCECVFQKVESLTFYTDNLVLALL